MIICRFYCAAETGPAFVKIGRRCPVCGHKMFPHDFAERMAWARCALALSANRQGLMPKTRRILRDKSNQLACRAGLN